MKSAGLFLTILWSSYFLYQWVIYPWIKSKTRLIDWGDLWHVHVTAPRRRMLRNSTAVECFWALLAILALSTFALGIALLVTNTLQPLPMNRLPPNAWHTQRYPHEIWQKPTAKSTPSCNPPPPVSIADNTSLDANTVPSFGTLGNNSIPSSISASVSNDQASNDMTHSEASDTSTQLDTCAASFPYAGSLQQNHRLFNQHMHQLSATPSWKARTAVLPYRSFDSPKADTLHPSATPTLSLTLLDRYTSEPELLLSHHQTQNGPLSPPVLMVDRHKSMPLLPFQETANRLSSAPVLQLDTCAASFPYAGSLQQNHRLFNQHMHQLSATPSWKARTAVLPYRSFDSPEADTLPPSAIPALSPAVLDRYTSEPELLLSDHQTQNGPLSPPVLELDRLKSMPLLPFQETAKLIPSAPVLQLDLCSTTVSDSTHTALQQVAKQMTRNVSCEQSANQSVRHRMHRLPDTHGHYLMSQKPTLATVNTTTGMSFYLLHLHVGYLCLFFNKLTLCCHSM